MREEGSEREGGGGRLGGREGEGKRGREVGRLEVREKEREGG